MASSFSIETRTAVPVAALFDESLSIDVHVASMAESGESAVGGVTSGTIGLGESVTWRARHFGIRFTMTSWIAELERPARFVDEQLRGPFRSFRHEHVFSRDGDETVMVDTVTVASPILGRLAERAVLVPYLRRLIRSRNRHLLASLGGAPGTAPESPVWRPGQTRPFRRFEASTVVGHGDASWERVSQDLLDWKVKTRSGFAVEGARPASPGAEPVITVRFAGRVIREPVRVETVVETPSRVGFSYRTLPGHPVSGEEAFIAHRDGDAVVLTIRSLTAAAPTQPWRALHPLLRIAQAIARRRYIRALR